jgi:hypothetical protein
MDLYISLGCDCSVSYQLRKLGLQHCGSMPFDWMKLTSIDKLISILDNNFRDFQDFSKYDFKAQSPVFDYIVNDNSGWQTELKSLVKMTHKEYGFTLPHEYRENMINIVEFENKYSRRIERFISVGRNANIHKIFVRLCDKKEDKKEAKQNKKQILENALYKLGFVNFQIKYINMDSYSNLISLCCGKSGFNWRRDYIPWSELLQ